MSRLNRSVRWSILVPTLVLTALSSYYALSQPAAEAVELPDAIPLVVPETETAPLVTQTPTPDPEVDTPQLGSVVIVTDEVILEETAPEPEAEPEVEPEVEPSIDLESLDLDALESTIEEVLGDEMTALLESQFSQTEGDAAPLEDAESALGQASVSTAQPLASDIYNLAGAYTSDMGISVNILFVDGFYTMTFQGITDRHHTITEVTPPSGNTLHLSVTLTNLPITMDLVRDEAGLFTITAYMAGSTTPILSTTATKSAD